MQRATHFVDTNKAIFTWVGDDDKLYYSDTPDHKDAVAVQLVWHSAGSLQELNPTGAPLGKDDFRAKLTTTFGTRNG